MATTSSFPAEEEGGEGASQKRKGCGHGHHLSFQKENTMEEMKQTPIHLFPYKGTMAMATTSSFPEEEASGEGLLSKRR